MPSLPQLLPLLLLALAGCGGGEASYRYRMTVEVDTPSGVVRGSSVHELTAILSPLRIGNTTGKGGRFQGEAVVIDLPQGPLFALLELPDAKGPLSNAVTVALDPDAHKPERDAFYKAVRGLGGWFGSTKAELPSDNWPLMVRFRNVNDPTTVRKVSPSSVGVRRIMLETTSDQVTDGLAREYSWLTDGGLNLDPQSGLTTLPTLAQSLRQRDFSMGLKIPR